MKKIFILTGEPSGDKLASTVIAKLKQNYSNIEYLSVGGSYLNSLGVRSIYDLKNERYENIPLRKYNKDNNILNNIIKSSIQYFSHANIF